MIEVYVGYIYRYLLNQKLKQRHLKILAYLTWGPPETVLGTPRDRTLRAAGLGDATPLP